MRPEPARRPCGRRGVSLPEVVIAAGLFLIMLTAFAGLGMNSATEWARTSSSMAAANDAGLALQVLGREIRNGARATVGTNNTELTVIFPAVTAGGEYDRFQTGATVRYYISGTVLYRHPNGGSAAQIGRNVSAVWFGVNGSELEVRLTGRTTRGRLTSTTQLNTRVVLRNYSPI